MHEPCGAIFVGEGARAWPREGAGAAGGYQDSLADLAAGQRGEGLVSVLERAGTGVDPDRVDRRGANAALVRVAWIRRGGKRPISSGPAPQDGGRRTLDRPPGLPGESGSAPVDRMQCGGRGDRCRLAGARRDRCDQDGSSSLPRGDFHPGPAALRCRHACVDASLRRGVVLNRSSPVVRRRPFLARRRKPCPLQRKENTRDGVGFRQVAAVSGRLPRARPRGLPVSPPGALTATGHSFRGEPATATPGACAAGGRIVAVAVGAWCVESPWRRTGSPYEPRQRRRCRRRSWTGCRKGTRRTSSTMRSMRPT